MTNETCFLEKTKFIKRDTYSENIDTFNSDWEYCLGKHYSNKTEKNCQQTRQAIRIIYPAEYTREKREEVSTA